MPNYVINTIKIEGEQSIIDELISSVKSNESDFDFEKIIPSPESMKIESGSNADMSLAIYKFEKDGDDSDLSKYLLYSWVKGKNISTTKELSEYLKTSTRYSEELGKKAYTNIAQHGCKDWYEWNIKYWGTKWNSSDSSSCGNSVSFQTAWSTPYPVIEQLSKKYPTLVLIISYADEDIGSNCGLYKVQDGKLLEEKKGDIVFSCEMWGYNPADYDKSYARDQRIDEIIKK